MEWRELDSASYLGSLYGGANDGFYTSDSHRMQSTVNAFIRAMKASKRAHTGHSSVVGPAFLCHTALRPVSPLASFLSNTFLALAI